MADRTLSTSTRVVAYTVAGCVVWLLVLGVAWASQPLNDNVLVGFDAEGAPIYEDIECSTLFDSDPLPAASAQRVAENPDVVAQEPCESVHDQARVLAVVNVALVVIVLAAVVAVVALRRPSAPEPAPVGDAVAT
ncbi:MAG: hypothetical protein AAGF73_11990 [Actinomycetota bacterium]